MEPLDPRIKAGAAWGGVGISKVLEAFGIGSWGDFAAMLAAFYSVLLIAEWIWKKWREWRN
jgi:hypothetical protein